MRIIGLSEENVRNISFLRHEPQWLLDYRLQAYNHFMTIIPPTWGPSYGPIDYQSIVYYDDKTSNFDSNDSWCQYHDNSALDIVYNNRSVTTISNERLEELGIIFCSIQEAVIEHEDIVRKYFGTIVPYNDNYFATLNTAVFGDGAFCYIPQGVQCPIELSSYFKINDKRAGQFERSLIIAESGASVNYSEGCTAIIHGENQLHASIVEVYLHDSATVKYSTVQNWYPGDENGNGGVYSFGTKRCLCAGNNSKMIWAQVELGAARTWIYPSTILNGNYSNSEFYSMTMTDNYQESDSGTNMIHNGQNTRSKVLSKSVALGHSKGTFRSKIKVSSEAINTISHSKCDSLILNNDARSISIPMIDVSNTKSDISHEASTATINEDLLTYCQQRGLSNDQAISLIVSGECYDIFKQLPLNYIVELKKIIPTYFNN